MQMLCMHRKKICTQDAYLDTRIKLHWGTVLHLLCKHIVRKYEDTIHAVTYVCNYHVIVLYMYVCIYIYRHKRQLPSQAHYAQHACMSVGQNYLLPATDMAKVCGPLSVVKVCMSENRVSASGRSPIGCEGFCTNLTSQVHSLLL